MGSVVISLDGELAWGYHDLFPLSSEQGERVSLARDRWLRLIALFDEYEIPATWAIVGQLLTTDRAYWSEHPLGDDWFETAKNHSQGRPGEWDGSDLVEQVRTADVDHELGSHSFSHPVFTEISASSARAECRFAREIGHEHDVEFESFVFPRNAIAHREILAETDFRAYRGRRPHTTPQLPGLQGAAMLGGYVTGGIHPPLVEPTVDAYGLVNVPASMFLGGFRGRPWSTLDALAREPGTRLAKLGIDRACREDGIFHLWLHPHDLTARRYLDRMRDVLSYLATKRREDDLRIETMRDVAGRIQTDER